MKNRSSLWIVGLVIVLTGCGEGAKLVQETDTGGVVVYPFVPGQGALVSSFRRDAIRLIEEHCRSHYHIVREGETKGRSRVSGTVQGAEEVIHDHRWGIQFECR